MAFQQWYAKVTNNNVLPKLIPSGDREVGALRVSPRVLLTRANAQFTIKREATKFGNVIAPPEPGLARAHRGSSRHCLARRGNQNRVNQATFWLWYRGDCCAPQITRHPPLRAHDRNSAASTVLSLPSPEGYLISHWAVLMDHSSFSLRLGIV